MDPIADLGPLVDIIRQRIGTTGFHSWASHQDSNSEWNLKINRTIYVGKYHTEAKLEEVVDALFRSYSNLDTDTALHPANANNFKIAF